MEGGRTPLAAAAALLACSLAGAQEAPRPAPRWTLAPGAIAEYALFPVTPDAKTGERRRGAEKPFGLFGHRVVAGRLPRPLHPSLADLGRVYALALPPEAAGGAERTLFADLTDCGPVEVTGKWTAVPREDGRLGLRADLELRHRGPPKSDAFNRILLDGTLAVTSVFDPARGAVAGASFDLRARTLPDEGAVKDRRVAEVRSAGDLELRRTRDGKDPDFPKDVDAAIARGVEWLRRQPKKGAYDEYGGYPGGSDALAALTLFACDPERKDGDAALSRALTFEPTKTYQAAVTMMAVDMKRTPPGEAELLRSGKIDRPVRNLDPGERSWMERGAAFLLKTCVSPGRWNYPSPGGGRFLPPPADLSNSQYAVLGLLAAHRCGVEIEDGAWLGGLRAFTQVQEKEGPAVPGWLPSARRQREAEAGASAATAPAVRARGFPYRANEPPSGSMTCAGIASVAICRDVLRERGRAIPPDLAATADRSIADGFGWLEAHWSVEQAPHGDGHPRTWLHYYLYALERAGILADVARVNAHDWYAEGALHLLLTQEKDGWWTQEPGSPARKIADTCFALLFLKRAVTPVATR